MNVGLFPSGIAVMTWWGRVSVVLIVLMMMFRLGGLVVLLCCGESLGSTGVVMAVVFR